MAQAGPSTGLVESVYLNNAAAVPRGRVVIRSGVAPGEAPQRRSGAAGERYQTQEAAGNTVGNLALTPVQRGALNSAPPDVVGISLGPIHPFYVGTVVTVGAVIAEIHANSGPIAGNEPLWSEADGSVSDVAGTAGAEVADAVEAEKFEILSERDFDSSGTVRRYCLVKMRTA